MYIRIYKKSCKKHKIKFKTAHSTLNTIILLLVLKVNKNNKATNGAWCSGVQSVEKENQQKPAK